MVELSLFIVTKDGIWKRVKHRYFALPARTPCNSTSTEESKQRFVRKKANDLLYFLDEIVEQSKAHGKAMSSEAIGRVVKEYGYVAHKRDDFLLRPEEVAVIRDCIGTSTNGIYRFKSSLETLCPKL